MYNLRAMGRADRFDDRDQQIQYLGHRQRTADFFQSSRKRFSFEVFLDDERGAQVVRINIQDLNDITMADRICYLGFP